MGKWRTFHHGLLALIVTVMAASSCTDPLGPSQIRLEHLDVKVNLTPTRIAPDDSLAVRVTLLNRSMQDTIVGFAMGCPFYLEALWFGETGVELDGTTYACTAVGSAAEIAAEDSVVYRRHVHARIGTRPAPSGTYTLRVDFTTNLPNLETSFQIE